jgi:hypothetical protein
MALQWRRLAAVTSAFDELTPVCCYCSVDIPRPSLIVFELTIVDKLRNRPEAEIAAWWRHLSSTGMTNA